MPIRDQLLAALQMACALSWLASTDGALAAQLIVGNGASISLGSATIDAGCRDLDVLGTIDLGSGTLRNARDVSGNGNLLGGDGVLAVNGHLDLAPALQAQNGTVAINDGCDRSQSIVSGNHQFNRLIVSIANDHSLILPANGTQAIASALELQGGIARLIMRSSVQGVISYLSLASSGSQSVNRVDALDVGAPAQGQYLAPQPAATYDSIDQGNTPRFFADDDIVPVPALGIPGLALLISLFAVLSGRQLRPEH